MACEKNPLISIAEELNCSLCKKLTIDESTESQMLATSQNKRSKDEAFMIDKNPKRKLAFLPNPQRP